MGAGIQTVSKNEKGEMQIEDKYGCVMFEDTHEHKSAWVSEDDTEPFYISDPADLSSDVIWITNLPYDLSAKTGYLGHGRFRNAQYLRLSIDRLSHFLGLDGDLKDQAVVLGALFGRVMRLVNAYILQGEEIDDYDLKTAIRKVAGGVDHIYSESFSNVLESSKVFSINCLRQARRDQEIKTVFLRCMPIEHARFVLSTPLPVGKWSKTPPPEKGETVYDWLLRQKSPVLTKIKFNSINSDLNAYINFGSGKNIKRVWITGTELVMLLNISDVEVLAAYESETLTTCKPLLDMIDALPKVCDMSMSVALFLDNIWVAIGASHKVNIQRKTEQDKRERRTKAKINISQNHATPFLRAQDRFYCYQKSLEIAVKGFDVLGYGAGCIRVNVADKTEKEILDLCREVNLLPPMLSVKKNQDPNPDCSSFVKTLQTLYGRSMLEKIIDADRKIVQKMIDDIKKES